MTTWRIAGSFQIADSRWQISERRTIYQMKIEMKTTKLSIKRGLTVLIILLLVSCQRKFENNSINNIILLETDTFVVFTSTKAFENHFEKWVSEHKDIPEDDLLFKTIIKNLSSKNNNAYETDGKMKLLNRLNYRTADLLEEGNAYVHNKLSNENVPVIIEKEDTYRKFKVENQTILHTIDRIY